MNVIISNKYQSILASLDIDVIESINGEFSVDELIARFSNFYFNKMIIDITAIKGYEDISVMQNLSVNFDMTKSILLLDDSPVVNSAVYLSQLVSMGIYNFTSDANTIKYLLYNPNSYKDVAQYHHVNGFEKISLNEKAVDNTVGKIEQKVLGIKNITEHAGATTLSYLLKQHLQNYYKVKAVEIDKNDFTFFNDDSLDSISSAAFNDYINNNQVEDVIIVDLNESNLEQYCTDVIYLIEPGIVQLNKLIRKDNTIFEKLANKKIVLNKSVLNDKDVSEFERESGSKVFYNLSYLCDRLDNQSNVNYFLAALGFTRMNSNSSSGIFGIFK